MKSVEPIRLIHDVAVRQQPQPKVRKLTWSKVLLSHSPKFFTRYSFRRTHQTVRPEKASFSVAEQTQALEELTVRLRKRSE